jgi:UTP:GlnB (protein PII) uridylyltransferase
MANSQQRRPRRAAESGVDPFGAGLACPDDDFVLGYVGSMRASYRRVFDEDAQHEHAAIAYRRGGSATHVEIWRQLPSAVAVIAVIADDRPGLLSCISAAMVAHDLDVVAAQVNGRKRPDGPPEAVDFFWVQRLPGSAGGGTRVGPDDVARLKETLNLLVRAEADAGDAASYAHALRLVSRSARVELERRPQSGATLLFVEAEDRPGLLLVVSQALYEAGVQIVGSLVTTRGTSAHDRFLVTELDGSALNAARQLAVQTAVLTALGASEASWKGDRDLGAVGLASRRVGEALAFTEVEPFSTRGGGRARRSAR